MMVSLSKAIERRFQKGWMKHSVVAGNNFCHRFF